LVELLGGLAGGTIATGTAYLADISDTKEQKKNFAIIGAAFGLGFILGPIIGGLMGEISVRAPFFLSALLSFLNFFLCLFLLPETLRLGTKNKFRVKKLNPFFNLSYVVKRPLFKGFIFLLLSYRFRKHSLSCDMEFLGREVFGVVFRNDWVYFSVLRLLTFYSSSICNSIKVL